jgi:hypothetical protein
MDRFGIGHGICLAGGFFGWIAIALIVGGQGPDIFMKNSYVNPLVEIVPDNPDDLAAVAEKWNTLMDFQDAEDESMRNKGTLIEYLKADVVVSGLARKNQVLYVQSLVQKPGWGNKVLDGIGETFELEMAVWQSGYAHDLHLVCDMMKDYSKKEDMLASGHFALTQEHPELQSGSFRVQSSVVFLDGFPAPEAFTTRHAQFFATAVERTLGGGIKAGQVTITSIAIPEWQQGKDSLIGSNSFEHSVLALASKVGHTTPGELTALSVHTKVGHTTPGELTALSAAIS